MNIDLFLWPMLVPMIIPLVYCIKYKREALIEVGTITIIMGIIVVIYWPFITSNFFSPFTYEIVKILLFIILPLFALVLVKRSFSAVHPHTYGVKKEGVKKSLWWCGLFIPTMLTTTGLISYFTNNAGTPDILNGTVLFFEAFTEEFFFRGILFVFLLQKTNTPVAYITSLACFALMHPQQLAHPYILVTIVQGFLTLEIARRTNNIIGSWILHGVNRFIPLAVFPFFF